MDYREGRYAAEVAYAGHGIQVWLQLLSHLSRLRDRRSVVLDEPDVYLHPDLQRRILSVIDKLNIEQLIVASHSVDLLNEFEMDGVIFLDKKFTKAKPLTGLSDLQRVTSQLGSISNSYLARVARSKISLFVEGDDLELLGRLASVAGIVEFLEAPHFAMFPIGGFENWELLRSVNWFLKNFTGEQIRAHVVLDLDYRCDAEVEQIMDELRKAGVKCHFWKR